jgi:hypothetical protein
MPLETGSFINDLTPSNPPGSDPAGQGDDHIRLIKATVQGTLPNMGAVFGQVRRQDVAVSISSTWNTNHFVCSASATATVVLTLPPAASITTGFFVDITTIGTGTVSLLPSGAASINGGVSLSIPRLSTTRAYFVTGLSWLADTVPHAQGGTSVLGNVAVDGTLSVSGASVLAALTVNGVATMSSAVHMKSTLSISGAVTMASTLSVSGASVLAALTVNGALTVAGTVTLSGTVVLSNGQLVFPASQNASAGANTLDDYEEGTWTPTLTFTTPGDLNVVYGSRVGLYTKIGDLVMVQVQVNSTTFTYTTASGDFFVSGLPFAHVATANSASALGSTPVGGMISGANVVYGPRVVNSDTKIQWNASNTTSGNLVVAGASMMASGTQKTINVGGTYKAAT